MELVTILKNKITTSTNTIKKLFMILDAIKVVKVKEDGSIYMEFQKDVLVKSNGHIVTYTDQGYNISIATKTLINPSIKFKDTTVEHINDMNTTDLKKDMDEELKKILENKNKKKEISCRSQH